jgi:hypothetical protein
VTRAFNRLATLRTRRVDRFGPSFHAVSTRVSARMTAMTMGAIRMAGRTDQSGRAGACTPRPSPADARPALADGEIRVAARRWRGDQRATPFARGIC